MIGRITQQIEKIALKIGPERAISLLARVPDRFLLELQKLRFRQTLRIAARTDFYREQFRIRGIDWRKISHPSEMGDFYTTGDDLRDYGAEAFLAARPDTAFETTGTTSALSKIVYFSKSEMDGFGRASAIALHNLGLRCQDVVISAFDVSFWVSPAVLRTALQYLGCFHVEAGKIPPEEFYERAKRYRPTVIFGEPSWVIRMSEIAADRGVWPIKLILAGGENINEESRRRVEEIWGTKFYLNYGQTEAFGVIGVECPIQQGYHRNDFGFIFEILDSGSDGYGELVYTTLSRDVMPLIRYRSTDITRIVDEPCECGLFAKRIAKIRGRVDEMVVCGMGNISPWIFADILRDVPLVSDEWQVRVRHEKSRDSVELIVEAEPFVQEHVSDTIREQVMRNLKVRFPDMWKNLEMRLYDFQISLAPVRSLRTTRKLKRIIVCDVHPDGQLKTERCEPRQVATSFASNGISLRDG